MTSAIESTHCVLSKDRDCDIEDDRKFEVVSKEFDDITHSIIFDDEDSVGSVRVHTDEDEIPLRTPATKAMHCENNNNRRRRG